jgi:uncharacterized protein
MASSLLALLDDVASLLDDVAYLTKVATKKTAGVLGDDLALNAEQVSGIVPDRELPVIWAVAKGSAVNKLILVPTALALSVAVPWLITPLLMLGGAFLCFEGFEKVAHRFLHPTSPKDAGTTKAHTQDTREILTDPNFDVVAHEKEKIRGAIRTDFILSAEIIVIALGTVQHVPFWTRAATIFAVALVVTVGVYLLVAAIVKMDDAGLKLAQKEGVRASLGRGLLWVAPRFIRLLAVLGTVAMFLVGGGIIIHGIPVLHHLVHGVESAAADLPTVGLLLGALVPTVVTAVVGLALGGVVAAAVFATSKLRRATPSH